MWLLPPGTVLLWQSDTRFSRWRHGLMPNLRMSHHSTTRAGCSAEYTAPWIDNDVWTEEQHIFIGVLAEWISSNFCWWRPDSKKLWSAFHAIGPTQRDSYIVLSGTLIYMQLMSLLRYQRHSRVSAYMYFCRIDAVSLDIHVDACSLAHCISVLVLRRSEWVSEQCFTSPPTQYRLYGRRFYRSKDPINSIKVLKEMLQKTNQTTKTTKWTNNNVHKKDIHKISTTSPLVYNNMGWLGGQLAQRAGLLGLNGGVAVAAVPPYCARDEWQTGCSLSML